MNNELTALTRPRFSSGVASCTSVTRTTTLMASAAPMTSNANIVNESERDRPNTMVATPNTPTVKNSIRPTRCVNGQRVRAIIMVMAPTAGAARNRPSRGRTNGEYVLGEDWQESHRAAQQNCEQIEHDHAEQDRVMTDERHAREENLGRDRRSTGNLHVLHAKEHELHRGNRNSVAHST